MKTRRFPRTTGLLALALLVGLLAMAVIGQSSAWATPLQNSGRQTIPTRTPSRTPPPSPAPTLTPAPATLPPTPRPPEPTAQPPDATLQPPDATATSLAASPYPASTSTPLPATTAGPTQSRPTLTPQTSPEPPNTASIAPLASDTPQPDMTASAALPTEQPQLALADSGQDSSPTPVTSPFALAQESRPCIPRPVMLGLAIFVLVIFTLITNARKKQQ